MVSVEVKDGESGPARDFVGVAQERPYRAGECRAALDAAVRDLVKVVRFGAVSQKRGYDAGDDHPVSAMRAGKEETRET